MKMKKETTTYAAMGMAALLPGMQYMIERMQAELDSFREQLAHLQNGKPVAVSEKRSWSEKMKIATRKYWANLTPEARAARIAKMQRGRKSQIKRSKAA